MYEHEDWQKLALSETNVQALSVRLDFMEKFVANAESKQYGPIDRYITAVYKLALSQEDDEASLDIHDVSRRIESLMQGLVRHLSWLYEQLLRLAALPEGQGCIERSISRSILITQMRQFHLQREGHGTLSYLILSVFNLER